MKKYIAVLLMGVAVLMGGCGTQEAGAGKASSDKLVVSAAASMQNALDEIKGNYAAKEKLSPEQIQINYGGSGTLREQIENGAPAGIFISASMKDMKTLEEKGLMKEVQPFTSNSLVLIVPKDKKTITLQELPTISRLAVGDVQTVPAGRYAKQTLTNLNLWDKVEGKIVYAKDVRSVLAYVRQGAAEAGFVYKTDAMIAKEQVLIADTTPATAHDAIKYPIGIVKKQDSPMAQKFYAYLLSPEAQAVLQKYGFGE